MMSQDLIDRWRIQFKGDNVEELKLSILNNLEYRLGKYRYSSTEHDRFLSTAYAAMERLIERWILTQQTYHQTNPKRVYYLSMEYLLGRSLETNLINLGMQEEAAQALQELGLNLTDLAEREPDAALGNGGLGRLAACFLDSMATLGLPAQGYGIRYDYGLFRQKIVNGRQVETPDNWLALPNPWEIARPEYQVKVRFGGHTEQHQDADGLQRTRWVPDEEVLAMPYDMPISGYNTKTVNTLRLYTARAAEEFNFQYFHHGDYILASQQQVLSENISKVLYPNDQTAFGKELRLKQEYFLVAAALHDIVRRFKEDGNDWPSFPDKVAIQLNDTHPALAVPELMRILVDEELLPWDTAWDLAVRTFGYTNHTVLPEALEEWSVSLMENLLPRHMEIIYLINHDFLKEVARHYPGDVDRLRQMSIIAEGDHKRIRMAYLSVVASHKINGVSALHSQLLKETLFRSFYELWPERFTNKTNGITPRRWLRKANPGLAALITETIGKEWIKDLSHLRKLEQYADDPAFQQRWREVKQANKQTMAELIRQETGIEVSPDSIFDVQVKRFHEYKRQLLFALYIIAQYLRIKDTPDTDFVPRTCIIGGKAAPGYERAKLIIRLINAVADVVNHDPDMRGRLRVVFLSNYRVSLAERLIPAANLSEQISTAGKEASGTGNMKFALNGAVTIGTLDGANIEIQQEVGEENILIFGLNAEQVVDLKRNGYSPRSIVAASPELQRVLHLLECDFFSPGEPGLFRPICDELINQDQYCLLADFTDYMATQGRAAQTYCDEALWTRMSILNVARCGLFSSDRTIAEYADEIWNVEGMDICSTATIPEDDSPAFIGENE